MILHYLDKLIEKFFTRSYNVRNLFVLEATVIRKCPKCGNPGVNKGQPITDFCPDCGEVRPPLEPNGIIYNSHPWWLMKRRIKRILGYKV